MFDLLLFAVRDLVAAGIPAGRARRGVCYSPQSCMARAWRTIMLCRNFFPVFIAAIIWIRGFSFFNLRFLGRMALCGLVGGLSFSLLLPLLAVISSKVPVTFWKNAETQPGSAI